MIKNLTKNARHPKGIWGYLMINKMNLGHSKLTKWSLSLLNPGADTKAVDLGCGGGKAVKKLLKKIPDGRVYGVDYSPLSVARAKSINKRYIRKKQAKIVEAGVSKLPFRSDIFDLATAIETIYFWPDIQNDLKEVLRILKPGGRLAIVCEMVNNKEDDPSKYSEVVKLLKMQIPSEKGLSKTLYDAGFKNVTTHVHPKNEWLCIIGEK